MNGPMLQSLVSFAVAAGFLTVTPGIDTALILRTATVKKARQAFLVALGASTGCILWCAIAALGLGALLLVSAKSYDIIRFLGAGYLLYLGAAMILKARNDGFRTNIETGKAQEDKTGLSWFCQGLFNNLLNPKVGIFYVTFTPQFIPQNQNVTFFSLLLGGIHAIEGLLWATLLILATQPLSNWLKQPKVTQNLDRLTGSILIGFGLKVATEQHSA